MDEIEIWRAAQFLIQRRGAEPAKQWAAQQAVANADARAAWLRILQAIIALSPAPEADTPLNQPFLPWTMVQLRVDPWRLSSIALQSPRG